MSPKIDIIIPIYNVEKYLDQCLSSVAAQTLHDIRLLCVDDGSTDGSGRLLDSYAKKDSRFVVINQQNAGYGAAMNRGLSMAEAEYVGIVEPDDFVDPVCFESLYRLATLIPQIDIAKFAYNEYYDLPNGTHRIVPSQSSKVESHLAPFKAAYFPDLLLYHPSIWSAIYRRSFLEENCLRFVEAPGAGWTDNPFFIASFSLAEKIVWSSDRHYYYRMTNQNSSSNLKDCTVPLLRALDMLDFLDAASTVPGSIRQSVFKRCINYVQVVTAHPLYSPQDHNSLICRVMSRLPQNIQSDDYFTLEEKRLHRIFSIPSIRKEA